MLEENTNKNDAMGRIETSKSTPGVRDANRAFDERFWQDPVDFFRNLPRLPNQIRRSMFPKIDIIESDTGVKVIADIPGVDPDDMYIDVRDNRMIMKGSINREEETDTTVRPYKYERMYGEFRREFTLPAPVDEEKLRATYKNGILTVTAPKTENTRKGRIKVERL